MPYWLFLKKQQNLKLSSAANYRYRVNDPAVSKFSFIIYSKLSMADNGHWQLSSIQDVGDGERTSAPFNYSQTCIAATYIKVSILTVSLR